MRLGKVIKKHREDKGLSQYDLRDRLEARGFKVSRPTISNWETSENEAGDTTWNPKFIKALADIFETTELEILHDAGFDLVPPGFKPEDIALAMMIRSVPDVKMRERLVRALLVILELFEQMMDAGDDETE